MQRSTGPFTSQYFAPLSIFLALYLPQLVLFVFFKYIYLYIYIYFVEKLHQICRLAAMTPVFGALLKKFAPLLPGNTSSSHATSSTISTTTVCNHLGWCHLDRALAKKMQTTIGEICSRLKLNIFPMPIGSGVGTTNSFPHSSLQWMYLLLGK